MSAQYFVISPVCQKLNEAMFAASSFLLPPPQTPPTYSSTHLPSPSVFPSLIPGAQQLFLLLLKSARGLCVSAYVFDDEAAAVKNEAGGGNLSTLEGRMVTLWQSEARRRRARRWGFFCVRPGMMKWMRFLHRCIKQTVGRREKERGEREGSFLYLQASTSTSSICFSPSTTPSTSSPSPPILLLLSHESVFKGLLCNRVTLSLFLSFQCNLYLCWRGNRWQNANRNEEWTGRETLPQSNDAMSTLTPTHPLTL